MSGLYYDIITNIVEFIPAHNAINVANTSKLWKETVMSSVTFSNLEKYMKNVPADLSEKDQYLYSAIVALDYKLTGILVQNNVNIPKVIMKLREDSFSEIELYILGCALVAAKLVTVKDINLFDKDILSCSLCRLNVAELDIRSSSNTSMIIEQSMKWYEEIIAGKLHSTQYQGTHASSNAMFELLELDANDGKVANVVSMPNKKYACNYVNSVLGLPSDNTDLFDNLLAML